MSETFAKSKAEQTMFETVILVGRHTHHGNISETFQNRERVQVSDIKLTSETPEKSFGISFRHLNARNV